MTLRNKIRNKIGKKYFKIWPFLLWLLYIFIFNKCLFKCIHEDCLTHIHCSVLILQVWLWMRGRSIFVWPLSGLVTFDLCIRCVFECVKHAEQKVCLHPFVYCMCILMCLHLCTENMREVEDLGGGSVCACICVTWVCVCLWGESLCLLGGLCVCAERGFWGGVYLLVS